MPKMLKFEPTSRDRMFYDKYEYGICIGIHEAGILRAKTLKEFEGAIEYRNYTRSNFSHRNLIDANTRQILLTAWNELDAVRESIKLIVSFNIMYVYSNNKTILKELANSPTFRFYSAVKSIVDKPRDVILKTDPKFKLRSYFKERNLSDDERNRLLEFIENREDSYGVTPYFKASLSRRHQYHWLQRHQFVEHNDAKDITMLSLVLPGLIRKTVSVQAK